MYLAAITRQPGVIRQVFYASKFAAFCLETKELGENIDSSYETTLLADHEMYFLRWGYVTILRFYRSGIVHML
jgi:hypothetical protein